MKKSLKQLYIFAICFYFVALPINAMRLGRFGSAMKIAAILPIFIMIFGAKKVILKGDLFPELIYTLFASASVIWSLFADMSIERAATYIQLFVLLLSGTTFRYSQNEICTIKKSLVWSSRLTWIELVLLGKFRRGRLWLTGIIDEDPNYICAYFLFGMIACIQNVSENKMSRKKILAAGELALYLLAIFLTGSRGGLLAAAAGILTYLFFYKKLMPLDVLKRLVVIAGLTILGIFLISQLPDGLKSRFSIADVINSGGSGRTEIWMNGIDLYIHSGVFRELFGYGTSTIENCFKAFQYSRVQVMHNIFLENLVELGAVGFVLYCWKQFSYVRHAYQLQDKFAFGVIMGMVAMSMSTSLFTFKPYYNIMLFIIISCNVKSEVNGNVSTIGCSAGLQCGALPESVH